MAVDSGQWVVGSCQKAWFKVGEVCPNLLEATVSCTYGAKELSW